MSEVRWIKIVTDIFDDEKILLIESLPASDSIITVWFKLLCLAGKQNNKGVFLLNDKIAYTDQMLATIFRRDLSVVQLALRTFEQFGMIEIIDGVITIPNWNKHQSLDILESRKEYMRNYMREKRKNQKLLAETASGKANTEANCEVNCEVNVNTPDIDIDKEIDKEVEKEVDKDKSKEKPVRHKYGEYSNVLLSDEDMEKLKNEYPDSWENWIERLSSYMESTGTHYKNHLATIRNWARKDNQKQGNQKSQSQPYEQRRGSYFQPTQSSMSYEEYMKVAKEVDDEDEVLPF